jgi:hypothetical protein
MLGNSDSYPLVMAGLDPGLDPAIRSGTSLRQLGDCVTGRDEWVATNERWYYPGEQYLVTVILTG